LSRKLEPEAASLPQQNLFGEVDLPSAEAEKPKRRKR
jgi:hypothetical protein